MSRQTKILTGAAFFASAAILPLGVHAQIVIPTTGTFNTNDEPTLVNVPADERSANYTEYTPFFTNVAAQHSAGLGGRLMLDDLSGAMTSYQITFGDLRLNGTAESRNVSTGDVISNQPSFRGGDAGRPAMSGNNALALGYDAQNVTFSTTFNLGSVTTATGDPTPDTYSVNSFGFFWTGNSNRTVSLSYTAVFDNGSETSGSFNHAFDPDGHRWLGVTAPLGNSIESFTVTAVGGDTRFPVINDIAFTVIPEPRVYAALFGLFALGFVVWRRRVRR